MDAVQLNEQLAQLLSIGPVRVEALWIPQRFSRNANSENGPSLNYLVCVSKGNGERFTCEYTAGMGHLPKYPKREKWQWSEVAEQPNSPFRPKVADLLYSLITDMTEESFRDWCDSYGFDVDSRKALDMYEQCRDTTIQLQKILGATLISDLRDLFQDY